jgi:hypothetical protein
MTDLVGLVGVAFNWPDSTKPIRMRGALIKTARQSTRQPSSEQRHKVPDFLARLERGKAMIMNKNGAKSARQMLVSFGYRPRCRSTCHRRR